MISTILLVFAFVLFVLAAWRLVEPTNPAGYRLVAAGLAFWVLSILLGPFLPK